MQMAELMAVSSKIVMKVDTGVTENGKTVYKNVSIPGVNGAAEVNSLAAGASALSGLLALPVERRTLVRTDVITN